MSRRTIDLLLSALISLFCAWMVWEAREWPSRTRLFPWSVGLPVLGLALTQFGLALWSVLAPDADRARTGRATSPWTTGRMGGVPARVPEESETRRLLVICAWASAFFLGLWLLGFRMGSALLTLAFLRLGASEPWKLSVPLSTGTYLFFLFVFDLALGIPFPPGLLAEALGLRAFDSYVVEPILRAVAGR